MPSASATRQELDVQATYRLVEALQAREHQLAEARLHDPLTGLPNQRSLADATATALERARRARWSTALLVVDIDQFRDINDEHGHAAGDRVLVEVAARLDAAFRPYDTIARPVPVVSRFAGDEFVIVCENVVDAATAQELARRIGRALVRPIVGVAEHPIRVSAAVGIALALPGAATGLDGLLLEAETAMRSAKARGRGAYEVFSQEMRDSSSRDVERALDTAIDNGELRLAYQPKVVIATEQIAGVEALLRWERPGIGAVPPASFIPVAEASWQIVRIGSWVIEEACRQTAAWHRQFPDRPPLVTSVNVSARQFGIDLVRVVAEALEHSRIPPKALCLEVTESTLMADMETAIVVLNDLAELGVRLSIDDFGTGYSSLSYLKGFPLDELKIDKSFVDGLGHDQNDTAIVAAIVAMAHALGLSVVAEGVETAEQLDRLRTLGCEEAQGYYFARPQPPGALVRLLSAEAAATWRDRDGERAERNAVATAYRADRVLIVDDADDVRQLARMSLTSVGFEVHEAASGSEALAMVEDIRPDCILLDLMMPGMSGTEVCRGLRAMPASADWTIVMLTGNAEAVDKVEAFSAGADDYIIKPFSPRDLVGRVQSAMRRRADQAAEGSSP